MDPRDAILQVQQIREQLARAEAFRVFRAASVSSTGVLAFVGSAVQARWQLNDPDSFLLLWIIAAAACLFIVTVEMIVRCLVSESMLLRDATIVAARQFVPSMIAGALLTLAIYRFNRESVHLLPGLWSIIFALGIFASRPGLPRAINFAGAYYLLAGLCVVAVSKEQAEFDTWQMPLCFGVGQLLTAAILYLSTMRNHDA
jgi:hypothetical protein